METSIFNVNGDSLPGPLIIGTFEKRAPEPDISRRHHWFPCEMTSEPGTSAEILTRGSKFSTNEKHYRDLGRDKSLVSLFRGHFAEKPVMASRMSAVFSPGSPQATI